MQTKPTRDLTKPTGDLIREIFKTYFATVGVCNSDLLKKNQTYYGLFVYENGTKLLQDMQIIVFRYVLCSNKSVFIDSILSFLCSGCAYFCKTEISVNSLMVVVVIK